MSDTNSTRSSGTGDNADLTRDHTTTPGADVVAGAAWQLVGQAGLANDMVLPITEQSASIGRDQRSDLILPSSHVDLTAASIQCNRGKVYLQSLSFDPIFVNNQPIQHEQQVKLEADDQIVIDVFRFKVARLIDEEPVYYDAAASHKRVQELSQLSETEKKWVTKPTSPGNRLEDEDDEKTSTLTKVAAGLITLTVIAIISFVAMVVTL